MRRVLSLLAATLLLSACHHNIPPNGIEFLTPYGPPAYPFSPAVRVGNLIVAPPWDARGASGARLNLRQIKFAKQINDDAH